MKIIIDATSLLLPSAGVKNYMFYWIRALLAEAGPDTISLFPLLDSLPADLNHESSPCGRTDRFRLWLVRFLNIRHNPLSAWWPAIGDVFHASQHIVNVPSRPRLLTSTIYDLTCWLLPDMHREENVIATRRYASRILCQSDGCIAISESARQDAIDILRIPGDRIATIYPGIAEQFFNPPPSEPVRKAHELYKPYFLYVGTIEPRKGVETLLSAYTQLEPDLRSHCDLVLAGMCGWKSETVVVRLADPPPGVRYLGYVPETALPALTVGATALVFPSLYEGFGFPVAQGMAAGVPVITSRGSSLEEVAAGACMLVTPGDAEQLSAAMAAIAESAELRGQLSARGQQRAQAFRWQTSARKSMEFFRAVGHRPRE